MSEQFLSGIAAGIPIGIIVSIATILALEIYSRRA